MFRAFYIRVFSVKNKIFYAKNVVNKKLETKHKSKCMRIQQALSNFYSTFSRKNMKANV